MDKSRNTSLDILRIIACFSIVMLHVSSRYMMTFGIDTLNGMTANFYDSINRFGVPIFVMISGALFLNQSKEIDMKRLWIHNILRIFIVYILWSYAYYAYQSIYLWQFDFLHQSPLRTATGIFYATDHLWYLGMLIGLYALTPVIKCWLSKATKQNIEYFLLIFVVFEILRTTLTILLRSSMVSKISDTFEILELTGYAGYYIFGYYLTNYEVPKDLRRWIYISVPIDIALNYFVSWKFSNDAGYFDAGVYDCFGLFTFLEVTALFMLATYGLKGKKFKPLTVKILKNLSADTFGIYLLHIMVLDFIYSKGALDYATPVGPWEIPVALSIFITCGIVAELLRHIPYVGRYIC